MTAKELADYIQCRLLEEGFIIQRYNAYSTASIYLKLDYGACNSIRISDHRGKQHLKYRYNIGSFVKCFSKEKDKYDRFYYRDDKVDNLIKKVISDKKQKLEQYGKEKYECFMRRNQNENLDKSGFWKQAYLVKE